MNKKRNPTAVFQALGEVLLKYPELRVGQAIVNALPARYGNDAFYIEDDELAECLRALADGQPSEDRLIAPQPTREGDMRALHFPNEHGDCPSWCAGCQSTPPQRCFFPDCQCVSTSLGDCKGEHYAPEVEQVKRERDLTTSQLLMVGSEICGDPKLDPKDHRDPRWTPTLEEAAKLRADNERLRTDLASAEEALRQVDAELTALAEENEKLRAELRRARPPFEYGLALDEIDALREERDRLLGLWIASCSPETHPGPAGTTGRSSRRPGRGGGGGG